MDEHRSQHVTRDNHETDLIELLSIIWEKKWTIACITAVFAAISVLYALTRTEIYRSEALLTSAESRQSGSSLASQFGAAANLIGIDVGSIGANNQTSRAIAIMESRNFIIQFIHRHDLLVQLMASTWDKELERSIVNPEIYDENNYLWVDKKPSDLQAYSVFEGLLTVNEDLNGLITVAIEWHDPVQAQRWVSWLVQDINELIKNQDLEEATNAIQFLQQQLASTQLVEMQSAFYELIESQTRITMLADVREEYVFRVVDPAFVPEQRIRPNRRMIAVIGTVAGCLFAIVLVLLGHWVRKLKAH